MRAHARNPLRAIAVLASAALLAYALQAELDVLGPAGDAFFADVVYNALLLLGAALCFARVPGAGRERAAWATFGAGILCWSIGDLVWSAKYADLAEPPFPSVADGFWLAFYPFAYVALVLLVRSRLRTSFRSSFWLDGAIAAAAVAAIVAALVFPAILDSNGGSPAAVALNLVYPVGDFILLAFAVGMIALTGWRPDRSWALIAAGLVVCGVADGLYLSQIARGTYVEGTILDVLWPLGALLLAASAWQRSPVRQPDLEGGRVVMLPSLFALAALALILLDHVWPVTTLAIVLAASAIALAALRMALVFREHLGMLASSRLEALTDPLTALGNRRRLLIDLDEAIASAGPHAPRRLAIFDLDGFKRYNDTYGHPAGDALLARLGAKLAAAIRPYGTAYRMGGDEFCILVSPQDAAPATVLAAAKAALSEGGEGFAVMPSLGSVLIPTEARMVSEALQIADRRMYAQKDRQAPSASRQTCDALLRVLREREPELYEHLHGVGELAVAVGRRLALDAEDLDVVCRAAELHDVGKMAVPDAILGKAGPLDADEWAYMRRHTLIGERVLSAVPALAPVARLVRSSHERWDGAGYPDGLRGEETPLGARIVAVCDAYDAMVTDRPYRRGMSPLDAVAELRRCSGSQFDPRVVDAFCAEIVPPLPGAPAAEEPEATRT